MQKRQIKAHWRHDQDGQPGFKKRSMPDAIHAAIEQASETYAVPVKDIMSRRCGQFVTEARQAAMMFVADAGASQGEIGEVMGRHHTTVSHGVQAARKLHGLPVISADEVLANYHAATHSELVDFGIVNWLSDFIEAWDNPVHCETPHEPQTIFSPFAGMVEVPA